MPSLAGDNPHALDGLELNETKDGLIVYDSERDRVHYLNATASVVFMLCDGTRDAHGIAETLGQVFDRDEPPRAEVDACLCQLRDEALLR
jgi:hypothetical protein